MDFSRCAATAQASDHVRQQKRVMTVLDCEWRSPATMPPTYRMQSSTVS